MRMLTHKIRDRAPPFKFSQVGVSFNLTCLSAVTCEERPHSLMRRNTLRAKELIRRIRALALTPVPRMPPGSFLRAGWVSCTVSGMKRYTPSEAQLRREWSRHMRMARSKHRVVVDTPENSEPWLDSPPRTVGDLIRISDEVARLASTQT